MRHLIASFLLLLSSVSQAATLIDFEEVTPQNSFGDPLVVESKGFTFEGSFLYTPADFSVDSNGYETYVECGFFVPPGCAAIVSMENAAGSSFSVLSIGSYQGSFSGTTFGGGSADLSAPIGTGDWLNLETFQVESSCGGTGCILNASLDDISVNVVPIPATVWLFSSALAGVGWLRRKQKV